MPKKEKADKPKKRKTITVNVTNLFPEMTTPKNMEMWSDEKPMTQKCQDTIDEMANLIAYVAKQLNAASEFKDNIAKRAIVLKCLMSMLIANTFMDNLHRYGVLHECMNDIHQKQHKPVMMLLTSKKNKGQAMKPTNRNKDVYVA